MSANLDQNPLNIVTLAWFSSRVLYITLTLKLLANVDMILDYEDDISGGITRVV